MAHTWKVIPDKDIGSTKDTAPAEVFITDKNRKVVISAQRAKNWRLNWGKGSVYLYKNVYYETRTRNFKTPKSFH